MNDSQSSCPGERNWPCHSFGPVFCARTKLWPAMPLSWVFECTDDGLWTCLFVDPFLPTVAVPMSASDEATVQAIASVLSGTSMCYFSLINVSNWHSASFVFMNPSNFLTSPVLPWDELLTTPAFDADAGMAPDIYTTPILDFSKDFDQFSLWGLWCHGNHGGPSLTFGSSPSWHGPHKSVIQSRY